MSGNQTWLPGKPIISLDDFLSYKPLVTLVLAVWELQSSHDFSDTVAMSPNTSEPQEMTCSGMQFLLNKPNAEKKWIAVGFDGVLKNL